MIWKMNSKGPCGVPALDPCDSTIGLEYPLEDLKGRLLNKYDDMMVPLSAYDWNSQTLTFISAPPGCGKTTLAQMLCRDPAIEGRFRNIFFVPVSQWVNIEVIVLRIYQHKGYRLPTIANDEDAVKQLKDLLITLGPYPVLLVLDDVLSPGLESFVDKFMFRGIPGYKLLVTSRFEHPSFEPSIYRLQPLCPDDAKILFCNSAACTETHGLPDAYVNQMVKACNGFPLALKVVGQSLRGMPLDTWESTLDKWAKGRSNILDFNCELLTKLGTSLHALDDQREMVIVNECFLDLGSFPEDRRILATSLTDIWAVLYGFDDEGMYALDMLFQLANRNLVNFVNKSDYAGHFDGSCQGGGVVMHDMFRNLAIHWSKQKSIEQRKRLIIEINSTDDISNLSTENVQRPAINARLLSISSTGNSLTSNWCNMQLPKVEVLILNLRTSNYSFPKFANMINLKALLITNYGFAPAELSDFEHIGNLSGLKRMRMEFVSIPSLSRSTVRLTNLKKISFNMCEIREAFDSWADMFPKLEDIQIYCCPNLVHLPAGICDLTHLKKLMVASCNQLSQLPRELGKLINLQELRLNSCTKLRELPEPIGNLHKLSTLDISDCVSMSNLPTRIGELQGLRKLYMRGCWGLFHDLPQSVRALEKLTVRIDEPKAFLWKVYDNVRVCLVKEDVNLSWLHNLRKQNLPV